MSSSKRSESSDRWAEVKRLFLQAARVPRERRAEFLAQECRDERMRRDVEDLLAHETDFGANDDLGPATYLRLVDATGKGDGLGEFTNDDPSAPRRIGEFTVRGLLGEGASGIVYLGESSEGARVAIKVMRPGVLSPSAWRRFVAEPQILAQLEHSGIARVIARGTLPAPTNRPYFVTEYVPGASLVRFADDRQLDQRGRLALFLAVCDAMQHAHASGVIHRDLKPANILVDALGNPKIVDFGVARVLAPTWERATVSTMLGQVVGTLEYMAPEQLSNSQAADTRSDVYSLGAILYEMLAGRPPIEVSGLAVHDALTRIGEQAIPRLAQVAPETRGDLDTIVHHALARDPNERYSTVAEFAADLRRLLDNEPISVRRPTVVYVVRKWIVRRKLVAGAAAFVLGMALVAATWLVVTGEQARRNARDAQIIAGSLLGDALDYFGSLSGAMEKRRAIIAKIDEPIRSLAEGNPNDPQHQFNAARLLEAKGDLAVDEERFTDAMALRVEALDRMRTLVATETASAEWQAVLSIAIVKVGDLLMRDRRVDEARALYDEALAVDQALVAQDPDNVKWLDQLAWSYLRIAADMNARGELAKARSEMEMDKRVVEHLLSISPDRVASLHAAFTVIASARQLDAIAGADQGTLPDDERMLALSKRMLELEPNNRVYQRQHVDAIIATALRYFSSGSLERGFELIEQARAALKMLNADDAQGIEGLRCEASLESVAFGGLRFAERYDEATAAIMRAIRLSQQAMDRAPDDLHTVLIATGQVLGVSSYCLKPAALSEALRPYGDEIRGAYARAIERLGRWTSDDALDLIAGRRLVDLIVSCPFEELRDTERAMALSRRLVAASPNSAFDWECLARSALAIGDLATAEQAAGRILAFGADASRRAVDHAHAVLEAVKAHRASPASDR
ncbi:MAG: protein kinase [Phycisphaerales bacterium]